MHVMSNVYYPDVSELSGNVGGILFIFAFPFVLETPWVLMHVRREPVVIKCLP